MDRLGCVLCSDGERLRESGQHVGDVGLALRVVDFSKEGRFFSDGILRLLEVSPQQTLAFTETAAVRHLLFRVLHRSFDASGWQRVVQNYRGRESRSHLTRGRPNRGDHQILNSPKAVPPVLCPIPIKAAWPVFPGCECEWKSELAGSDHASRRGEDIDSLVAQDAFLSPVLVSRRRGWLAWLRWLMVDGLDQFGAFSPSDRDGDCVTGERLVQVQHDNSVDLFTRCNQSFVQLHEYRSELVGRHLIYSSL